MHEHHQRMDTHEGHTIRMFVEKFWISFFLTIPVLLYSDLFEKIGIRGPEFSGSQYLPAIFSSLIFFYGGWIFISGARRELAAKQPGMMTLIGLAISAAYLYSMFAVFSGGEDLFWELATLITVMLLGHWMEMKAVQGTQNALKELSKLLPDTADVIRSGKMETILISELMVGDMILVRPGAIIPSDGVVIDGSSFVNESMVTGESKPVRKEMGSEIIAGTINGDGAIKAEVRKIGEQTFLAGIMRLVAEAQISKSKLQILSDRAAYYLTLIALASGTAAFISWMSLHAGVPFAFSRFVAVLVIACPHALGLAIPLVASISTGMAARRGFLIRNRLSLEMARNIDIVLFDKTGTLTKGEFGVSEIIPSEGYDENKILALAASVNNNSEHFIGRAIFLEAKKRNISLLDVKNFERIPGMGAKGIVGGRTVSVGNEALLSGLGIDFSPEYRKKISDIPNQGKTMIHVAEEKMFVGSMALADSIREESMEAVMAIKKQGIKVAMITGDSEDVAAWVARDLGIDEFFSKVLPDEKVDKVKMLHARGLKVAMVGDGVNDAPALAQADLGIAIGAGTNVAIESAGIILVRNDPRDIVKIIALSRATYAKMIQNLFWATGYNIAAIPLAAGVLISKGIILTPALGALLMSLSTVIVAINALLLKRKKI